MTKYYNKNIPIEISVADGGRHYGKTYREFEKIKTRIEELEKENKRLKFAMQDTYDSANDTCGELQQRIDKAIEYIEEYQDVLKEHNGDWLNYQDGFKPYLLKILKGSEK